MEDDVDEEDADEEEEEADLEGESSWLGRSC